MVWVGVLVMVFFFFIEVRLRVFFWFGFVLGIGEFFEGSEFFFFIFRGGFDRGVVGV